MDKKQKKYKSCYNVNRPCYRKDKTHYVYQEWVEAAKNQGLYYETILTVGDDEGVTLELLDDMQAFDDAEAQGQEDNERIKEILKENISTHVKGFEEEYYSDEEECVNPTLKAFNEHVRPHLSDEQMDLIYARYGMGMTLEEIAAEMPPNKDGSPKTHQAVSIRLNRIFEKVKKYMPQA